MPQLAQSPKGETAQERLQRRDALLRYGNIFSDTHRQVGPARRALDDDSLGSRTDQTEKDA
jgi:hypothetical protein